MCKTSARCIETFFLHARFLVNFHHSPNRQSSVNSSRSTRGDSSSSISECASRPCGPEGKDARLSPGRPGFDPLHGYYRSDVLTTVGTPERYFSVHTHTANKLKHGKCRRDAFMHRLGLPIYQRHDDVLHRSILRQPQKQKRTKNMGQHVDKRQSGPRDRAYFHFGYSGIRKRTSIFVVAVRISPRRLLHCCQKKSKKSITLVHKLMDQIGLRKPAHQRRNARTQRLHNLKIIEVHPRKTSTANA